MAGSLKEKVDAAVLRLQNFEPLEGYYLAFSGGKDSVVIKTLADMAGVKYDAHYRVTSVDPPELVRFIKDFHPDVERETPRYSQRVRNESLRGKHITMWNLIPKRRIPPTRIMRYCCQELKEPGGDGRMLITGVRWAESSNRKRNQGMVTVMGKTAAEEILPASDAFSLTSRGGVILTNDNEDSRRLIENCYRRHKTTVNPIIDWSDEECWQFINDYKVPVCELYAEGWTRLGCIGCPMSRQKRRERDFERWPKYKAAYLRAFDRMLQERKNHGMAAFSAQGENTTAQDVFNWWMEYETAPAEVIEELTEEEIEE